MGTSVREVMEDTVIEGKWLLKKAGMIQMPSCTTRMEPRIWGTDFQPFNPRRFLRDKNVKNVNPVAFRGFDGGSTSCPGRHFATNQILAAVSMFIMRFDMEPRNGEWVLLKTDNTNVAAVLLEPDADIEIVVEVRKGFEGRRWAFRLRVSEIVFAVVHEDRTD